MRFFGVLTAFDAVAAVCKLQGAIKIRTLEANAFGTMGQMVLKKAR